MRARKPCLRLRRRTFGWYVRFTAERSPSVRRCPRRWARRSAEYRRASAQAGYPQRNAWTAISKGLLMPLGCRPPGRRREGFPQLWRAVWRREEYLQIAVFFGAGGPAPGLRRRAARVVCSPLPATPKEHRAPRGGRRPADRRTPLGRRLAAAPGHTQRDDLRDLVRIGRARVVERRGVRRGRAERLHARVDREPFPRTAPGGAARRDRTGHPGRAQGRASSRPSRTANLSRRPPPRRRRPSPARTRSTRSTTS